MHLTRLAAAPLVLVAPAVMAQVPPPIVTVPITSKLPVQRMQAWIPGEARCGDALAVPVVLRRPPNVLVWGEQAVQPVRFRFRIDASGRPLSIARDDNVPSWVGVPENIGPALAASRFAAGAERRDCRLSYAARRTLPAETPVEDLVSYSLDPVSGPLPREGWAAIYPAGATCRDEPHPAPLEQVFPDFTKLRATPGVRDWTMFAYDLDRAGKPVGVRVLTGTGNGELDTAGAAALRRSRYAGGPRTGCRFPYWKAAAILPAPEPPATDTLRPANAACPPGEWATRPPLRYPDAWRKRSIEGWAIVAFDIAPWGQAGNVRVLAAEPAADFGEQAVQMIRSGTRAPSATGASGCVERVMFRMGRPVAPGTVEGG